MADEQVPQQSPRPLGQHDTNVLWPMAGPGAQFGHGPAFGEGQGEAQGEPAYAAAAGASPSAAAERAPEGTGAAMANQYGAGWSDGYGAGVLPGAGDSQSGPAAGWVPPGAAGSADAAYWEQRFRRQRTWTRFLAATIVAGLLLVVGGSVFVWNVVLPRAGSTLAQGLSDALPDLGVPGSGAPAPDQVTPNAPGSGSGEAPQDLSSIPLPDQLRGLGSMLGIDNVEELLDTAVSMGLMSQQQADQIREVVAAGGSLQGLLGSLGSGGSGSSEDESGDGGQARA